MNITKISNNSTHSKPSFAAKLCIDKTHKGTQQQIEYENTATHKCLSTEEYPVNSFPEALEYVMSRKDIMENPSILDHEVFILG